MMNSTKTFERRVWTDPKKKKKEKKFIKKKSTKKSEIEMDGYNRLVTKYDTIDSQYPPHSMQFSHFFTLF